VSDFPMPPKLIDDIVRQGALRTLELARETDMWDVQPMLGLVADVDGEALCIHVPVPDSLWRESHPAGVLLSMASAMQYGLVSLQIEHGPGAIRGLVLITEGHGVDTDGLTDAEKVTLDDFRARHRLDKHPKAKELRMAHMIDRSLTQALGRHFRGSPVSDQVIYGFSGTIPNALEAFMSAVLASWIEDAEKTN
jgi:hypothetical protein